MARAIDIIKGLEILCKYADRGTDAHIGGAEHDVIYGVEVDNSRVTDEDLETLDRHGWLCGEARGDDEGWFHFA